MSQPTRILVSLILGLGIGIFAAAAGGVSVVEATTAVAEPIGGIWLDALRMTIIPLVVALLVTGIASAAKAARAGQLAFRSLIIFLSILWLSAISAVLLMPLFFQAWPLPAESAAALRAALAGSTDKVEQVPTIAEFLRSIVPTNPVSAAANDAILPLIVFTAVFAFAMTRLPEEPRERLTSFFAAIGDTMLVVIHWVLWLAPIGVFALAYVVGARAGAAALGALLHYVVLVSAVGIVIWILAYPVAVLGGRVSLGRFARAVAPAQAVAVSTRSSLASLPSMLASAERLGVPVRTAGVVLPLAVALFRATGPAMNVAVVLYTAHWFGMELTPLAIAAGVAVAATTTLGAVSLPGEVSFVTSIAPIAIAMGVPVEPLVLLIAVETIPDIFRTVGNVTMDVAVTKTVAHWSGAEDPAAEAMSDGVTP